MEIEAEVVAPCTPEVLFSWVRDLDRYPAWHHIVTAATPLGDDLWAIDLRGRVGPLARTKRLRMRRVRCDEPTEVVFEREEVDGRTHSDWRLRARVDPVEGGSRLRMELTYDGSLWGPVLERVLGDEIERSRRQLLELVAADPEPA